MKGVSKVVEVEMVAEMEMEEAAGAIEEAEDVEELGSYCKKLNQ